MFHYWTAVCFQTQQDLKSVSQLLDSCTLMDLGSDLQTSRLLEHFSQARPHFNVSVVTLLGLLDHCSVWTVGTDGSYWNDC